MADFSVLPVTAPLGCVMYKPILPVIALIVAGTVSLGSGAAAVRSLTWAVAGAPTPTGATGAQLTGCKNHLSTVFPQVPATDITVSSGGAPDAQGNALVNWQLKDGTAGFCLVSLNNQVVRYEEQVSPSPSPTSSPTASPTSSPTATPSPTPSPAFDPQSLRDLNKDEAIARAEANGYTVTDASNPQRIYFSNNQQQIILNIRRFFNTVSSVEVTSLPTPSPTSSPSPIAFNPQSLVGLEKNRAIETAAANGYFVVSDRGTQVLLSNNAQTLALNIGQPYNTVTSVTPGGTVPSSSPATGSPATTEQLQSCRNFVGIEFYPAVATVYSGQPDVAGNAIVEWRTNNGASGYCRMNNLNNIVDFVVENPGQRAPDRGTEANRPDPPNALW